MIHTDIEQLASNVEQAADAVDILDVLACPEHLDQPEKRLMFATLADAIARLCRGIRSPKSIRPSEMRELRAWVTSDAMDIYSFVSICDILDIDVGRIRKAIQRYEQSPALKVSRLHG